MSVLPKYNIPFIKIECVYLKCKIYIYEIYMNFCSLNILSNNSQWNTVMKGILENIEIVDYINEHNILDSKVSDSLKHKTMKYILFKSHQEVVSKCLTFVSNEKRVRFKTFLSKEVKNLKGDLEDKIYLLDQNNVNIDDINLNQKLYFDNITPMLVIYSDDLKDKDNEGFIEEDEEYEEEEYEEDYEEGDEGYYEEEEGEEGQENYCDCEGDYDEEDDKDYQQEYKRYKESKKSRDKKNKKNESYDNIFIDILKKRNKKPQSLIDGFKKLDEKDKKYIVDELSQIDKSIEKDNSYMRVFKSKMSSVEKKDVLLKLDMGNTKGKFREWFETLLSFPFGKYDECALSKLNTTEEINNFLQESDKILNNAVYGHKDAKRKIQGYLSQLITNPNSKGSILGIEGPMGCGKTTLVEKGISKILNKPFVSIPLGGAQDGSFLRGHGYTYEGSTYGMIVNVLKRVNTLNPIIYFDELDKVSSTYKGAEIINILIHLTDPNQNTHFQDLYLGNFNIDLSKAMFIFSWNDSDKINPILLDRITVIKTKGFNFNQKIEISNQFLIPNIIEEIGIKQNVNINNDVIECLINKYTYEGGVRKLKEILHEILTEINLQSLSGTIEPSNKRSNSSSRYNVTLENFKSFLIKKIPIEYLKINSESFIGNINGLYATSNGVGGLIRIETRFIPSDSTLSLHLTGNLGKVMKESAQVAKTISWDRTSDEVKKELIASWGKHKYGIHVHCSEASVGKEGPSAGTALSICIYSMINKVAIRNDVGITGEMNLSGEVTNIGGLQEKMYGAKIAGCKTVLFPKSNMDDYNQIIKECPTLIDSTFTAIPISTFEEALKYALIEK